MTDQQAPESVNIQHTPPEGWAIEFPPTHQGLCSWHSCSAGHRWPAAPAATKAADCKVCNSSIIVMREQMCPICNEPIVKSGLLVQLTPNGVYQPACTGKLGTNRMQEVEIVWP